MRACQGIDSVVRVLSILRRKKFDVADVWMEAIDKDQSSLVISIRETSNLGLKQAMLQIDKLVDVYDIREIREEVTNG